MSIDVRGLTKRYGGLVAVDAIDLPVLNGRLFGFLGPNGAGKSTTIGCMTGLLDPDSGSVNLLGNTFTPQSVELKRRIGVMPEGLALFDQLYPYEFLMFQAGMFSLPRNVAEQRAVYLLQALDLLDVKRKRLVDCSTGTRKKVAFAAALIHGPEILFLDEPFEGIDPVATAMLKDWLRHFVEQGKTVFLTSHVLESVEKLCDEAAIMIAGKIVWRGEVAGAIRTGAGFNLQGRRFATLEDLFLHLTGRQNQSLPW